jgi:hypothetical protein
MPSGAVLCSNLLRKNTVLTASTLAFTASDF